MKVSIVTPSLHMGGAERWICALVQGLQDEGHEVLGIQMSTGEMPSLGLDPEIMNNLDVPVFCHPDVKSSKRFPGVTRTRAANGSLLPQLHDCDVVVMWGNTDLPALFPGFRKPVVWVAHAVLSSWYNRRINDPRNVPHLTHVVAVSQAIADTVKFPPWTKNSIIHNGVDINRSIPILSKEESRRRLGIPLNKKIIGYCGRFSIHKGLEELIKAVDILPKEYALCFVGQGIEAERVAEFGRTLLGDRFMIIPPVNYVRDVLAAFDCFGILSKSEGFSLSITEAMAAGVPVVSTPVGVLPELDKKYGQVAIMTSDTSAKAVASCLRDACSGSHYDMVDRARNVILSNHTLTHFSRDWARYLERVTGCQPAKRPVLMPTNQSPSAPKPKRPKGRKVKIVARGAPR